MPNVSQHAGPRLVRVNPREYAVLAIKCEKCGTKLLNPGQIIGYVLRVGTLRSCTRWIPCGPNRAQLDSSRATRRDAVLVVHRYYRRGA